MIRPALFLAALAVTAPAFADTVRCTAMEGGPALSLEVTFTGEAREAVTVTRLDADLGDFTISTAGNLPERIAGQESVDGRLSIDLADPGDTWIVLRLKLVRDTEYHRLQGDETDENWRSVVAGTLSVLGVGVWPVTCEGW
jgi:hypothetical protein